MSQVRFRFSTTRLMVIPSCFHLSNQVRRSLIQQPRSFMALEAKKRLDAFRVENTLRARAVVKQLLPEERFRLRSALLDATSNKNTSMSNRLIDVKMDREQMRQLFIVNTLPFIGFGFIDNFLMIVAAEYIEHSLGVLLAISTMAAAGLGHIVADVAGIGLTHYVEFLVSKARVKHPVLTAEQLNSPLARKVINMARLVGLVVGCLIGMFPLLF